MNYGELKTSIQSHMHRDDLTTLIPDFVLFAESVISGDPNPSTPEALCGVRTRDQSNRFTATINSEYVDTPTDMLSIKDIQINTDPIQPLDYLTPSELSHKFPSSTTGKPRYYSIHGDEFQFKPVPSTDYVLEVTYEQKYTALANDADTNWLLTNHPLIYVYSACIAASLHTEDSPDRWVLAYTAMAKSLNSSENKGRYPSRLVAKVNTPTP